MTFDTPQAYARHLATYITSPTKIEAYTRLEFGEAPPLHWIANERYRIEQRRKPMNTYYKDNPALDGKIYSPAGMGRPPEEQAAPEPRKRDYLVLPPPKTAPNPFLQPFVAKRVIELVAKDFGCTTSDLTGPRRHASLVDARAVVVAALKRWGRHSYPQIGKALGGRDHSTVIHAREHFDIYCRRNPLVGPSYDRLARLIEEAEREIEARQQDNELELEAA